MAIDERFTGRPEVCGREQLFSAFAACPEPTSPTCTNVPNSVSSGSTSGTVSVSALNNLLSATHLWATSEAVAIGERFGIEPGALLNVINGSSGRSGSSQVKWPKFILSGGFDSGFSAALMLKDAKIAAGLMRTFDVRSEVAEQIVSMWQAAVDDLPTGADHTEIAKWIRDRSKSAVRG